MFIVSPYVTVFTRHCDGIVSFLCYVRNSMLVMYLDIHVGIVSIKLKLSRNNTIERACAGIIFTI